MFSKKVLIFDGGIGTELYKRGYYINRPFEELNINAHHEVQAVHTTYANSGADVLTTNTYSASRPQLLRFDIADKQEEILRSGINLAYDSKIIPSQKIALSIGPLGELLEPLGPVSIQEAEDEFARIAAIAQKINKVDLYSLESFTNLKELHCAIHGIYKVDKKTPILASISINKNNDTLLTNFIETISCLSEVSYLGLNCSEGPSVLLDALKVLVSRCHKPIVIQPNAGLPRQINGRYFYMSSPDYLAKMAKRYVQLGASGIGGCCGTGPNHIKAISNAIRMLQPKQSLQQTKKINSRIKVLENKEVEFKSHSKILENLAQGKKIISVEVLPPKGVDISSFLKRTKALVKAGVSFLNIPDGARANTRISSLHLAGYINRLNCGLTAIPHFTTRDRNLIGLQSDLLGAHLNDVHDILVVTGDPPKLGNNKEATAVYDIDSIGLTHLVDNLNRGISPNGELLGGATGFGIGVASNPTAMNLDLEYERWKHKVDMGADYAITQPIFHPESYFKWQEKIKSSYKPHIVGIWPLISYRNAEFLAHEVPGILIPDDIMKIMSKFKTDPEEAQKRGLEIAHNTMDVLKDYCDGFCISAPLGKVSVVVELLS